MRKKIISIKNSLTNIKIYTSKKNIEVLKKNSKDYIDNEIEMQNTINYYENKINELQEEIDEYVIREEDYKEEINYLKDQIVIYENNYEEDY